MWRDFAQISLGFLLGAIGVIFFSLLYSGVTTLMNVTLTSFGLSF